MKLVILILTQVKGNALISYRFWTMALDEDVWFYHGETSNVENIGYYSSMMVSYREEQTGDKEYNIWIEAYDPVREELENPTLH